MNEIKNGIGKLKLNRVNLSLSNFYYMKLKRLSISCDKRHTTMADLLLQYCLDNPKIIHEFQNKFNKNSAYGIITVSNNDGALQYITRGEYNG